MTNIDVYIANAILYACVDQECKTVITLHVLYNGSIALPNS